MSLFRFLHRLSVPLLFAVASLAIAPPVLATSLLYSNVYAPAPDNSHDTGWFSYSNHLTASEGADDFRLDSAARIETISWVGYMPGFDGVNTDFRIRIYDTQYSEEYESFIPNEEHSFSLIGRPETEDIDFQSGSVITRYTLDLDTEFVLGAGTYFLSVQGLFEGGAGTPIVWGWNHGDSPQSTSNFAVGRSPGSSWFFADIPERNHQAFDIYGTVVPVPSSIFMFLGGLLAVFRFQRS